MPGVVSMHRANLLGLSSEPALLFYRRFLQQAGAKVRRMPVDTEVTLDDALRGALFHWTFFYIEKRPSTRRPTGSAPSVKIAYT
jgi:hypothetical protein